MYDAKTIEIITIEVTSFCNARCPQCNRFDEKNNVIVRPKHLSLDVTKKINQDTMPNLKEVIFEGDTGDVLNHPDALEIARSFEWVENVTFFTNASVRNPKFFESLAGLKNFSMVFSVDGLKDTNHMYRQNTNFDKIMANAQAFISAGGRATWKFIVFEHNQHQLDQVRTLSQQMGFEKFWPVQSDRSWYHGSSWPVYNKGVYKFDLKPSTVVLEQAGEKLESDHTNLSQDISDKGKKLKLPITCPKHENNEVYMDYDGNIIPCCMLSQDWWNNTFNTKNLFHLLKKGGARSINLNYHNVEEIFNSQFYVDTLPQSLKHKPMPKCVHYCGKYLS